MGLCTSRHRLEDITEDWMRANFDHIDQMNAREETVPDFPEYIYILQPNTNLAINQEINQTLCAICLEDMCKSSLDQHKELTVLKTCGHVFGNQCINDWMFRRRCCPLCNKEVCFDDLQQIYVCDEFRERINALESEIERLTDCLVDNSSI